MRIAVIGNGAAGNEAAETIRKYDKDAEIIMFSQEDYPEYSPCALPDYIAGWIPRTRLFLKEHKDYEDKQIRTEFGSRVNEINIEKREVVVAGKAVSYDKLIIATGSKVFVPPVKGADLPGNFVLKSVSDVDSILDHGPKKVAVIGAGNIGVEIAAALKLQGCQVALVEVAERVMPKIFAPETGLTIRDEASCIGCRACEINCPFGACVYDYIEEIVVNCDLCGGNPACVQHCPTGALNFMEIEEMMGRRREKTAHEQVVKGMKA